MITREQALQMIEKARVGGYVQALAEVHALIGSHMSHADRIEEVHCLDALGRAVYEMVKATE